MVEVDLQTYLQKTISDSRSFTGTPSELAQKLEDRAKDIKPNETMDNIEKVTCESYVQTLSIAAAKSLNALAEKDVYSDQLLRDLSVEEQLLADIKNLDTDNEFYYTVPIETHLALEFTGTRPAEKSLMNPAMNYDINNINNSFVISKIDIDYLTDGITLARASRLS